MADIYELAMKIAKNERNNPFEMDNTSTELEVIRLINNLVDTSNKKNDITVQNQVANSFNNTISRYVTSYQNDDGTISNENIRNLTNEMGELQFQYEKQFPNSVGLLESSTRMFNNKFIKMAKDNAKYDSMNFEMNRIMGEGKGTIASLIDKYANLTESYVLENREELINELSEFTSRIDSYNKEFVNNNFASRFGSNNLTGNMTKSNLLLKSLQQQLLDIDDMSPNKILTKKERLGFTQYLENDNSDLLEEIVVENKANRKNKKTTLIKSIEDNIKEYSEANSILSLEANKNNIEAGITLSDLKGEDSQLTAKEWKAKKNRAFHELHIGNFNDRLKNLSSGGFGYMDLYSDTEYGQYIKTDETLRNLFDIKTREVNIETPLEKLKAGKISREQYQDFLAKKLEVKTLSPDLEKRAAFLEDEQQRPSPTDLVAPTTPTPEAPGVPGEAPEEVTSAVDVQGFLDISAQKYAPTSPSKDEVNKWKDELKKTTGWTGMGVNQAVTKLNAIYRDTKRLERVPDNQKEKVQREIDKKTQAFQDWAKSPGWLKSIAIEEQMKKLSNKELISEINQKKRGGRSGNIKRIQAAKNELRERRNIQKLDITPRDIRPIDLKTTGSKVTSTMASIIENEKSPEYSAKHNNPGNIIWTSYYADKYGAEKGKSFWDVLDSDGNKLRQVYSQEDANKEEAKGNKVKQYWTAKFKNKNDGNKAFKAKVIQGLKKSKGDADKVINEWAGII